MRDKTTIRSDEGEQDFDDGLGSVSPLGFRVSDRRASALGEQQLDALDRKQERPPSTVERLEGELARARADARAARLEMEQRLSAEIAAASHRLKREQQQLAQQSRAQMAAPMLEVFEAIERSTLSARQLDQTPPSVVQGLEMLEQLMVKKLAELGIERVQSIGERFDPTVHEAVALMEVQDEQQDGLVVAELSPGFRLAGQLMRPPKVQVGRAAAKP